MGGTAPKIKLNKLQTKSEQNVQRGTEQMLRGLYMAIRNPRSHEKVADSEDDATTLILFIGFIVRQIETGKAQFSLPEFIRRVIDPDFVPNARYAELLVEEVPPGQRLEVFFEFLGQINKWNTRNSRQFLAALMPKLTEDERSQAFATLSNELKVADDETVIRHIIGSIGGHQWDNISEVARLRIEHMLINSIREGRYDRMTGKCKAGGLGSWAADLLGHFSLKSEALWALIPKLSGTNGSEHAYVFEYFFSSLAMLSEKMPPTLERLFIRKLSEGDSALHTALSWYEPWDQKSWSSELASAMIGFEAREIATRPAPDDIPF